MVPQARHVAKKPTGSRHADFPRLRHSLHDFSPNRQDPPRTRPSRVRFERSDRGTLELLAAERYQGLGARGGATQLNPRTTPTPIATSAIVRRRARPRNAPRRVRLRSPQRPRLPLCGIAAARKEAIRRERKRGERARVASPSRLCDLRQSRDLCRLRRSVRVSRILGQRLQALPI